jgi:drug/metabolite transporter (DMT)-like permease
VTIESRHPGRTETILMTALALVAFASNSLLTRMALGPGSIDAATFTAVRLAAGAVMLVLLVRVRAGSWLLKRPGNLAGAATLCLYAAPFSYAYVRIGAAAGALVLFGVVQITMIGWGIARGERPSPRAWLGFAVAVCGLILLTLPSASRPDPLGLAMMALAGVAWGAYSLLGRGASDPVAANCRNFT